MWIGWATLGRAHGIAMRALGPTLTHRVVTQGFWPLVPAAVAVIWLRITLHLGTKYQLHLALIECRCSIIAHLPEAIRMAPCSSNLEKVRTTRFN